MNALWEELRVRATRVGKRLVGGVGPQKPLLAAIGESLGEQEEINGRPFVGTDGIILDGILLSARVERTRCYISNVVKIRPPNNKVGRLGELGFTIEDFIPLLKEELEGLDCKVCVAIGDLALNVLCGRDEITKHRGSIYRSTLVPSLLVVPTLHPGYVRELWPARGTVVEDFKKAKRVAEEGYKEVAFNTIVRPTIPVIEHFVKDLEEAGKFCYDIEAPKGGRQIICLGLGGEFKDSGMLSLCIPFKHGYIPEVGYSNYWKDGEEAYIWSLLQRLFQSNALKIGQNVNYDITLLAPLVGEPAPPWYDTMVAHHTIDPELPHKLAYLTSIYTDVPYYKDDPKDEGEGWATTTSSERLWEYNGKDVEVTLSLEAILTKEMKELGVYEFFVGYLMPSLRAMWRMQQRGMTVDEEVKARLLKAAEAKLASTQEELEREVGHPLNVNSSKQMMQFLYEELKLPIQYHRKTRKPTANKETLDRLFTRYPNPTFTLAMEIRGKSKEIGTYLKAIPDEDGKYRGTYNICGTETGRSSCKKTLFGTGLDMQNVPRTEEGKEGIRQMFVAPEGKVFLFYDLWQAEVVAVAYFSEVIGFIERLSRGNKIHTMVASWIYGKPEAEVNEEEYYTAKRVVHAADYGLGPNSLSILIKQPVAKAKEYLRTYFLRAPEIAAGHEAIKQELGRTRRLVTPFGRVRFFRQRYGEDMFREAYAHRPQSTVADYLRLALLKLEYLLPEGAVVVQEGFDSLIVECERGMVREVREAVKVAFDKTLLWKGKEFKIPYEEKEGRCWK